MTERICSIDNCERTVRCKNMCGRHYDRVRRWGSPHLPPERRCELRDCERKHYAHGYCKPHYKRVYATGDPHADRPLRDLPTAEERLDIEARILAKSVVTGAGCIEWRGTRDPLGYGSISWQGRSWRTHRAMWTAKIGELPPWPMVIDHLCRNTSCCNVEHLEVVHQAENAERGGGRHVADAQRRARREQRATCPRGHDRSQHEHVTPKGYIYCRACRAERHAAQKRDRAA